MESFLGHYEWFFKGFMKTLIENRPIKEIHRLTHNIKEENFLIPFEWPLNTKKYHVNHSEAIGILSWVFMDYFVKISQKNPIPPTNLWANTHKNGENILIHIEWPLNSKKKFVDQDGIIEILPRVILDSFVIFSWKDWSEATPPKNLWTNKHKKWKIIWFMSSDPQMLKPTPVIKPRLFFLDFAKQLSKNQTIN